MSNHSKLRFLVVLLFAAFATAALVSADIGALAQNANSSTTGGESAQDSNANMMGTTRRGGRGRRGRRGRRARRGRAANAAAVAAAEGGAMIDPNGGAAAQSGDVSGEQTDLSGTYAGHMTMTGGHEMSGEVSLTITGNTFTITGEGMTHNGRVYAVTTRGYTGASFYFSDISNPATNTPVVATVRARKRGDGLWLSPVPGTQTRMTFGTGGGGGGGRGRRGRRARRSETMTAPSPDATGDATGDASATGDAAAAGDASMSPAPRRRRGSRRGRRRAPATNTNANTGDNSNATPPM